MRAGEVEFAQVHRDIKGGNILVEKSGRIKLADFGMAKQMVEKMSLTRSFKGSAFWMAPEVIAMSAFPPSVYSTPVPPSPPHLFFCARAVRSFPPAKVVHWQVTEPCVRSAPAAREHLGDFPELDPFADLESDDEI